MTGLWPWFSPYTALRRDTAHLTGCRSILTCVQTAVSAVGRGCLHFLQTATMPDCHLHQYAAIQNRNAATSSGASPVDKLQSQIVPRLRPAHNFPDTKPRAV